MQNIGEGTFWKTRLRRWGCNIEMNLRDMGCEDWKWMELI
jgi:hypothetical protein